MSELRPTLEKPPYGMPCNGCGLCCMNEICPIGSVVFPHAVAPYPALKPDGERYVCGLVTNPEEFAPIRASVYGIELMRSASLRAIGAGIGCDARLDGETSIPPREYVEAMREIVRSAGSQKTKILKLWGPR